MSGDRTQIFFDQSKIKKKMSLSVQHSVVDQFRFMGKCAICVCQGRRVSHIKRCLQGNWIRGRKR